jgi:tetratricopeptide (TPR) repeat protein
MENTKLVELRRAYETELAAGRYSTAEQVCWRALEICGYGGPRRKFSYWLTSVRLNKGMVEEESLWQWACSLADIYYELGRYSEAEPVYARLAVIWMSSPSELKGRAAKAHSVLPELLRKLAGAEAVMGKERRAGKHWKLAKKLSGKCNGVSAGLSLRSLDGGKMPAPAAILRGATSRKLFSRWESIAARRRSRRSR